jgi:hypothetical protein
MKVQHLMNWQAHVIDMMTFHGLGPIELSLMSSDWLLNQLKQVIDMTGPGRPSCQDLYSGSPNYRQTGRIAGAE